MTGQIIGGPEWMDTDRFDVMASMPQGTTTPDMIAMVRSLLDNSSGGISMTELALPVSAAAGRPVLDRTGPQGFFALRLTFETEPGAVSPFGRRSRTYRSSRWICPHSPRPPKNNWG